MTNCFTSQIWGVFKDDALLSSQSTRCSYQRATDKKKLNFLSWKPKRCALGCNRWPCDLFTVLFRARCVEPPTQQCTYRPTRLAGFGSPAPLILNEGIRSYLECVTRWKALGERFGLRPLRQVRCEHSKKGAFFWRQNTEKTVAQPGAFLCAQVQSCTGALKTSNRSYVTTVQRLRTILTPLLYKRCA